MIYIYAGRKENRICLPEEHLTKNGFSKKNGVYMIDTEDQLFKLREMLREGMDAERVAKALRRHWERGDRQDGLYVSMTIFPDLFGEDQMPADAEKDIQNMREALCTLAGPEYTGMIREAMEQEEGYLWFANLGLLTSNMNCPIMKWENW